MRRFALHQQTNHRRSLPIALLGVLLMTGVSLAATSTPAGASPGSLSDIDVTAVTMGTNVIAALTVGGTIQVEVVTCTGPACDKHGWTSLGSGFKSVTVQYLTGPRVVVIARRDDGATWYKRGNCSGTACSWESWRNLGGAVINVLASNATGCALLAGQTSTKRVYQAQVCGDSVQGWTYTGGQLSEIANDGYRIFGTSASGQMWWYEYGEWRWAGGNVTQPVWGLGYGEMCGLSDGARHLWCVDRYTNQWTYHGGSWRKLDDQKTIGIGQAWDVWTNGQDYDRSSWGGKVNEVAWSEDFELMVGVGSDYHPWYQTTAGGFAGGWRGL